MELKVSTCKLPEAWENVSDQVTFGFSFASDWLRGWREFSRPITERRKAKPMQSRITFDTQLKITLIKAVNLGVDVHQSTRVGISLAPHC